MGIKFLSIFILFFILSSIFLFYQKISVLPSVKIDKNIPVMKFIDAKSYDITYKGIENFLQAKIVKRYKNRDEMFHIYSSRDIGERLWADKGVLKNNILKLFGHVLYKDDSNRTLSSNTVTYNIKKDILSSDTNFVTRYGKSSLQGSSFIYYKKTKKLLAKNIKADIYTER